MPDTRRTLFPIAHPRQFKFYKKALASFWTTEEVDLTEDRAHFQGLTEEERGFVRMVLGFFASADSVVAENLAVRFLREDGISMETACFYGYQVAIENIHSEMYSLFIDALIKDPKQKQETFDIAERSESVAEKTAWAVRYVDSEESFCARLLAFACVEGIFFSASFCAIFWLKKRGLMPGLAFSNELIARDEGMHRDFALLLLEERANEGDGRGLPRKRAEEIAYVEFCADNLLSQLFVIGDKGEPAIVGPLFKTANPFDWMETISLNGKTNFFERRVSEYQKSGVMNGLKCREHESFMEDRVFTIEADF
eukprot:gene29789-37151_t